MAVHCRWCVRKYKEGQFVDDFVQDSDIVISRSDVCTYTQVDCWAIYSLLLIDSWIPIHQPPPIRLNRTRIFNFHTSHVTSRFSYHRIAYKISRRPLETTSDHARCAMRFQLECSTIPAWMQSVDSRWSYFFLHTATLTSFVHRPVFAIIRPSRRKPTPR